MNITYQFFVKRKKQPIKNIRAFVNNLV